MNRTKKTLILLATILLSRSAFCQSPQEELQAELKNLHSMTAQFQQVMKAKNKEISNSSGTMALLRPGRFRWQTLKPMKQLIIADGQKLWIYDPDLEQVSVKKQEKGLGGTAALFLSGYDDHAFAQDFRVEKLNQQTTNQAYELYSISPKATFTRVKLIFTQHHLTIMELFDQLGQHTIVHLNQIRQNTKIPMHLFQFKPPKGVDVVRQ